MSPGVVKSHCPARQAKVPFNLGSCRPSVLPDPPATNRTDGSALITARDVGLDFGATPRDVDAADGAAPANKQLHLHRVFDSANANGSSGDPNGSGHLQVRNQGTPFLLPQCTPHAPILGLARLAYGVAGP